MALAGVLLMVVPLLPVPFDLLKKQRMQHHRTGTLLLQLLQAAKLLAEGRGRSHHQG